VAESCRVAIVTGASQGIGAGIVEGFRNAGYAVVGTSRSIPASHDPNLLTVAGDIAEAETARHVVEQALDRFGRIDTLVNNAGIFVSKPFTDYTAADFAAVIGVNLAGFFQITQRVVGPMASQGGGHIVNITTTLVDEPDRERPAALVSLTKGGLAAVTRALAAEYASRGVRVNAVAPGVIQTSVHDPASYDAVSVRHPIGQVSDVVDAILYLERAPYVTGETLRVDGGWATGH
jgi:NAD(P)-dependent dehydrogenase (short-subunit alcohol dehydrogenase family)